MYTGKDKIEKRLSALTNSLMMSRETAICMVSGNQSLYSMTYKDSSAGVLTIRIGWCTRQPINRFASSLVDTIINQKNSEHMPEIRKNHERSSSWLLAFYSIWHIFAPTVRDVAYLGKGVSMMYICVNVKKLEEGEK